MRARWVFWLWLGWKLVLACPDPVVNLELSYSAPPYTEVAEHLKSKLSARGIPIASSPCPKLFIALGSKAAKDLRRRDRHTPLVLALVLDTTAIAEVAPATGVWLLHPLARQWKYLRRLFPKLSYLSVLYDPRYQAQALELDSMARRASVELKLIAVNEARQLAELAPRLTGSDLVFFLGDSQVFSLIAIQPLLAASYARHIPVVGLSAQWVEMGAAYALDWDWQDLAAQAADLVAALWSGTPIEYLSPQPPRTARLIVNTSLWPNLSKRDER